jgi:hypothetical protein
VAGVNSDGGAPLARPLALALCGRAEGRKGHVCTCVV